MRKLSILFLAFGIGTLVACGGSVEVTTPDKDKAEDAGGDKGTDEGAGDEGEADEGGDEEGGDEAATGPVCCKFKNPAGDEVKKKIDAEMCSTKSGEVIDEAECPDAPAGGGGGGGGKTGKRGKGGR